MSSANVTADLCRICDGRIECAPTALLLISLIHTLYGEIGRPPNYFKKKEDNPEGVFGEEDEYDFVVIGGGTAGSVVASRLSENQKWNVLLLEAGPEQPKLSLIPGLTSEFKGSPLDWKYQMRPKKGVCENRGQKGCEIVQARVLGGCSSINDLAYIRGNPVDYDEWALNGNEGWSYNKVLPYFKYSEGNYDLDINKHEYFHSSLGPLDVGRYSYVDDNVVLLLSALKELGYNNTDINGENQLGYMRIQAMTYYGQRVSSYKAFIEPIRKLRTNLHIITEALVTRILFEDENHSFTVTGVEYIKDGVKFKVNVLKEVILSAGTINSPKILMTSGIGPKDYLNYLNIRLNIDLPVGGNFHDHVSVCLPVINVTQTSTLKDYIQKLKDITSYYTDFTGPLSTNYQVAAFYESSISEILDTPDIEIRFKGYNSNMYYDKINICIALLTPKSRGQVMLNSTDPLYGKPLIYPNFLKEDTDNTKLLEGIHEIVKIFDTDVFKDAGFKFDPRILLQSPCYTQEVTDEFWLCIIKYFSSPLHNYVGTCKMGTPSDPESVVDNALKVYGTSNLRVVDASIIPKITRGATTAPVIMIAEKASDLIKRTWI